MSARRQKHAKKTDKKDEPKKDESRKDVPKKDPTILVGIDFGTTGTGVTYQPSWTNDSDPPKIITTWDDSNGDLEKVDSAVYFGKSSSEQSQWGISASLESSPIRWFKLMLIDEEDLPGDVRISEQVRNCRKQLKELNKTAVEVISFYLRSLWNHCLELITRNLSKGMVNMARFHLVFTIPAIWPEYARRRMLEAAEKAGLIQKRLGGYTKLSFVSEPEAAALATLTDIGGRPDLKPGDTLTIVDCGGGTVDIISYIIVAIAPALVFRECVRGQGGLWGAVFLENYFTVLLKRKFGQPTFDRISASDLAEILRRDWADSIRHSFNGGRKTWNIRQPYDSISAEVRRAGGGQPKITITSDDVREVFAPIVGKIQQLVLGQVDAVNEKTGTDPKFIVLVGGFGRNAWLHQCLKDGSRGIEVLQSSGAGPWTAICRGAIIHAMQLEKLGGNLNIQVASRIARISIGIACNPLWDPLVHDPQDKIWSEDEGVWQAYNQMEWFIRTGDDVSDKAPVSNRFRTLYSSAPRHIKTSSICMSRSTPPPTRFDASVSKFCNITWKAEIDIASLPPFSNPSGKIFALLNYEVVMTCTGGTGVDVEIIHAGQKQATKNIGLEFQDYGGITN